MSATNWLSLPGGITHPFTFHGFKSFFKKRTGLFHGRCCPHNKHKPNHLSLKLAKCPLFEFKYLPQFFIYCHSFDFLLSLFHKTNKELAKNFTARKLKEEFGNKVTFTRGELFDFYCQFDPELKESTFRWRIFNLKAKQIITSNSRNLFTLAFKPVFIPEIGETEGKIYSKVKKHFPDLKQCIWSTRIANEFMLHIPVRFLNILQVEKEALEPVFDFLKDQNFSNVFFQPGEKEIKRYIYETESAIILLPLISKSPTQVVNLVNSVTIEKMFVDFYCDKILFGPYQGGEFIHMIENAYNRYSIDFTKLLRYAERRGKQTVLKDLLLTQSSIPKSILND